MIGQPRRLSADRDAELGGKLGGLLIVRGHAAYLIAVMRALIAKRNSAPRNSKGVAFASFFPRVGLFAVFPLWS